MSITVWLSARTLHYSQGGGHFWVYLNWALGLRGLGCNVIWVEGIDPKNKANEIPNTISTLRRRLEKYGFAESIALYSKTGEFLPREAIDGCLNIELAEGADLLLNLAFDIPSEIVERFRRAALVDIDPGLTQIWISKGLLNLARHDLYFTIGETVGKPGELIPDCGLEWHYTPPAVYLPAWPPNKADSSAPYTTITHWWGGFLEFQGDGYYNGKRGGFLPFLNLPRHTSKKLELAVLLGDIDPDRIKLKKLGWSLRDPSEVASTPWDYQDYIQKSRGEFSCAKPSCMRLQNAWISDRTICYLASGKPAVVQHTGPSRFLPDSAGIFRFHNLEEAVRCLEMVEADYEQQCKHAHALAEEFFDSKKVVSNVLERALA